MKPRNQRLFCKGWAIVLGTIAAAGGGCAAPGPSALTHSVRTVPPDDRAAIWTAAQAALLAEGFTPDRVESAEGRITTRPVEVSASEERSRSSLRWSRPNPMRRLAEVRLVPRGAELHVYCKVTVQEQNTEAFRVFQPGFRPSDVPDETAIERDAATTREQNTVWQTAHRDKATEQRILETMLTTPRPR